MDKSNEDAFFAYLVGGSLVGSFAAFAEELVWRETWDVDNTIKMIKDLEEHAKDNSLQEYNVLHKKTTDMIKESENLIKSIQQQKKHFLDIQSKISEEIINQDIDAEKFDNLLSLPPINDQGDTEYSIAEHQMENAKEYKEGLIKHFIEEFPNFDELGRIQNAKDIYTWGDISYIIDLIAENLKLSGVNFSGNGIYQTPNPTEIKKIFNTDYENTCNPPEVLASIACYYNENVHPRIHRLSHTRLYYPICINDNDVYEYNNCKGISVEYNEKLRDSDLLFDGSDHQKCVPERDKMQEKISNILNRRDFELGKEYLKFLAGTYSNDLFEFVQIWKLYKLSKNTSEVERKSEALAACTEAKMAALSIIGVLRENKKETASEYSSFVKEEETDKICNETKKKMYQEIAEEIEIYNRITGITGKDYVNFAFGSE